MKDNLFCKEGENGFINWQFERTVEFGFEIDLSELKKILPAKITPLEVRPGVGIIGIGITKFPDGNLGCLSAFDEVLLNVYVSQNLRKTSPDGTNKIPWISCYMLSVAGNSDGFLKHTYLVDKMPIYICKNLTVENSRVENGDYNFAVYEDEETILDLKWTDSNFTPKQFEKRDAFIQIFLGFQGKLYYESLLTSGSLFTHQKDGNAGKLYSHPFFRGLDLSKVSSYCNFQFISLHSRRFSFYTPELLCPLSPKDFDPTKDNESDIKEFLAKTKNLYSV